MPVVRSQNGALARRVVENSSEERVLSVAEDQLNIPKLAGRSRARRWVVLASILAIAAGAFAYYQRDDGAVTDIYRFVAVQRRDVVQLVEATGQLDVRSRVQVPAPVPGRLVSISVLPGQEVKAGQVLAVLDARAAELNVRSAQAASEAAAGKVAQAKAALGAAERGVERTRALADKGLATPEDVANAESELASARAAAEAARAEQRVAGENVAAAKLGQSLSQIIAPASGVVLTAPESVGAAVSPERGPLFMIGESLSVMRVDTSVSETDIALVKRGQRAEVLVSAFPGKVFTGRVERMSIEPRREGGAVLYPVMLLVDNPDGQLLPGMSVRVKMEVARAQKALSVHEAALRFQPEDAPPADPRSRVWKHVGVSRLEPVRVRAGVSDGSYTVIEPVEGALAEGDEVAIGLAQPGTGSNGPRVRLGEKK